MGRQEESLPLLEQAVAVAKEVLGAEHPHTVKIRNEYAELWAAMA
jgi:hypothetical protein